MEFGLTCFKNGKLANMSFQKLSRSLTVDRGSKQFFVFFFSGQFPSVNFQCSEQHKQNSIHLYCILVEIDILEEDIAKPQ